MLKLMGIVKRKFDRDVKIKGVRDDIVYQEVKVTKVITVFGINVFTNTTVENILEHTEPLKNQEDNEKVGFKVKK